MTTRRSLLTGGAALIGAGLVPRFAHGRSEPATVDCPAGRFLGERLDDGVARFLGIRYAAAARFMAPTALPRAADTVRAMDYGPACPQRSRRQPQDEDCLTLNVWTPAPASAARLPVMVYIHGGAFAFGSASDPLVDGRCLANRSVVVVSINHRLNAFGYLYLGGLDPRFPDSGNAGQHDLVQALRWVRANIARFGGDPARITAFGDSGGGGKLTTLLAMPASAGLIHRAATMSGQQVTVSGPVHATRRARAIMARLKVDDAAGLTRLPAERLVEAIDTEDPLVGGPIHFGPVLDLRALDRHPFWPDAHPLARGVPMLTGNTRDETRGFHDPDDRFVSGMDWNNLPDRIAPELPVDLPPAWVIGEYRNRLPAASPADLYFAITTDGRSWRGQLDVAEARAAAGVPAWVYQVDFAARGDPRRGAFHGIDLPLVFGTFDRPGAGTGDDAAVRAVARALQDRFVAFARDGTPGADWPRYTLPRRATMIIDVRSRVVNDPRAWQRALFARAPYVQPGS